MQRIVKGGDEIISNKLREMEAVRIAEVDEYINKTEAGQTLDPLDNLLKDCVETEFNLYG